MEYDGTLYDMHSSNPFGRFTSVLIGVGRSIPYFYSTKFARRNMHSITPYINLTGNAEEAMNFYKDVFGGKIEIRRWSEMPPNPKMPVNDEWQNKVMHGSLTIRDGLEIYLSDSWVDDETPVNNNVFLHVEFDSEDELLAVFDALSTCGRVNMPVEKMFWGAVYGDLIDRFGTGWGLHYQEPE